MGIKNATALATKKPSKLVKKAAEKAADRIAKLAVLSPEQLKDIQDKRDAYFSEKPDPNDELSIDKTNRYLASYGVEIYNSYLHQLTDCYVPIQNEVEYGKEFAENYNIRYFNITKWVTDKKENSLEKLVNVYEVLSNENCNIALIFHRKVQYTEVYLAVTNTDNADNNVDVDSYRRRLADAIRGNFPGSEWKNEGKGVVPCLEKLGAYSVASVSNIPTEKSEKFISQTIEKLLDGIIPETEDKEYTLVLLATPANDVEDRKLRVQEMYSCLSPYASWQTNFTFTQSDSTNSMATFGVNAGVSAGIQQGQNQTKTVSDGTTDSSSDTSTDSSSSTDTQSNSSGTTDTTGTNETNTSGSTSSYGTSTSTSNTTSDSTSSSTNHTFTTTDGVSQSSGENITGSIVVVSSGSNYSTGSSYSEAVADAVGESITSGVSQTVSSGSSSSLASNVAHAVGTSASKAVTNTIGNSVANTVGTSLARTLGKAVTKTMSVADGIYKGTNIGANFGANFARSSNVTATVGKNEGITQNFTNYTIKHTLQILEEQMKRYEKSTAMGMWDFAAYIVSEDLDMTNNVAHTYLALTQGEKSYVSEASVNVWRGDLYNSSEAREIYTYIRQLRHPLFGLNPLLLTMQPDFSVYPPVVTATTTLSGKELAYSLNFPQKSVAGLPVIECVEFGRNIVTYDDVNNNSDIRLGQIFHMNHKETIEVELDINSLASHTFITGSTGSGKSNTVYTLLNGLLKNNKKFLVIEPAKGEYKRVYGNLDDVNVYGTNPKLSSLLRINPFSFPSDIHIFEHLDRLVEIFNVCWPMYAAMPAVLKSAIEKSYEDCGWDLVASTNKYGNELYPKFSDVARNIIEIINSSEYDNENKGAYKGSLLTRLQSLSNGVNGLIFVNDEIPSQTLFNENTIIDLSRIGSSETKSLIMGMLILKLQEYRLSNSGMNEPLNHVTVLEEAHNILKRTSTEHQIEGNNLVGKSVEMISNAIAEMRTYGEGFIIVDQAPDLLDMSAIRNTNTKIIMRLPDQKDRELVGKSAGLNDDQIKELAKLPCGVGAVYQNNWIQPVLCKVDKFDFSCGTFNYSQVENEDCIFSEDDAVTIANILSSGLSISKEQVISDVLPVLERMNLDSSYIVRIMDSLVESSENPNIKDMLAPIISRLFPKAYDVAKRSVNRDAEPADWTNRVRDSLVNLEIEDRVRRDIIQSIFAQYFCNEIQNEELYQEWVRKGGMM